MAFLTVNLLCGSPGTALHLRCEAFEYEFCETQVMIKELKVLKKQAKMGGPVYLTFALVETINWLKTLLSCFQKSCQMCLSKCNLKNVKFLHISILKGNIYSLSNGSYLQHQYPC